MKSKLFSTSLKPATSMHLWLLLFRVCLGAFMLTHGVPKLMKVIAGDMQFADPIGIGAPASLVLAVFAEAVCSAFLILGLATRIACVMLVITMIVAAFVTHAADQFGVKEMALLYMLCYLTILVFGPGKYSLDHYIFKQERRR